MAVRPASLPNLKERDDGLTEFGSISPQKKVTAGFLSKIWGSVVGAVKASNLEVPEILVQSDTDADVASSAELYSEGQSTFYSSSLGIGRVEYGSGLEDSGSQRHQHRSLGSVVRALSNILERKPMRGLKPYKEGDFRQYWMPDSSCRECYDCGDKFTTFRRRHHCRICGQIFCSSCCNQEVPGRVIGILGCLRACTYCCKVISAYVLDVGDTDDDLGELKEKLKSIADAEAISSPAGSRRPSLHMSLSEANIPPLRTNIFDFLPTMEPLEDISVEERNLLTKESHQLRALFEAVTSVDGGVPLQSHRHRLRTYTTCFTGHELVQWLIASDRVASHEQAAAVGQALVDARFITSPTLTDGVFHDGPVLYRPRATVNLRSPTVSAASIEREAAAAATEEEPNWLQELERQEESGKYAEPPVKLASSADEFGNTTSSSGADEKEVLQSRDWAQNAAVVAAAAASTVPESCTSDASQAVTAEAVSDRLLCELEEVCLPAFDPDNSNAECIMSDRLKELHESHLVALSRQLLSRAGLSLNWAEPLVNLARNVTHFVKPDVKFNGDIMDIRNYVHIKKLRSGQRLETEVVYGTVCTKQVVHKRMRASVSNASVMLLQSSIEYQRVANKFSSLDPQILQEQEYLRNCVAKIAKYKPDVLLVEKTVSRTAQELLLDAGITLVLNVKQSVMQRVARCTMADIVPSIDGIVSTPILGKCHLFELKTFRFHDGFFKTLMYFDGCPANLSCTILLRSTSYSELCKVKPVLSFLVYAYYSSMLEIAFMMDQSVVVTAPEKDNFVKAILKPSPAESRSHSRVSSGQIEATEVSKLRAAIAAGLSSIGGTGAPTMLSGASGSASIPSTPPAVTSVPLHGVVRSSNERPSAGIASDSPPQPQQSVRRASTSTGLDVVLSREAIIDPLTSLQACASGEESPTVLAQQLSVAKAAAAAVLRTDSHPMHSNRHLQKLLIDTVLSVSPMVKAELPYFETTAGRCSPLRAYFPQLLYWSPLLEAAAVPQGPPAGGDERDEASAIPNSESYDYKLDVDRLANAQMEVKDPHPLMAAIVDKPGDHGHVQALLASYRAAGSRLRARSTEKRACALSYVENGLDYNGAISITESQPDHDSTVPRIDCLDIRHHQRVSVLFSSFALESANAPELCVNPWVVNMHFYGRNDMTLGTFLERYCFRESYYCPSITCQSPMSRHVRRFAHESGCLHLVMKHLDTDQPIVDASHILMWNWCRKCKQATAVVPMSHSTWSMSFAKYLELRLQAQPIGSRMLPNCTHFLHRDYNQYFRYGRTLASFKYASLSTRELCLPQLSITFKLDKSLDLLKDTIKNLYHKAFCMYTAITEGICKIRETSSDSKKLAVAQMKEEHEQERTWFRSQIDAVQMRMPTGSNTHADIKTLLILSAEMVSLKRHIANAIQDWNQKLQRLVSMKEEKSSVKDEKSFERQNSTSKLKKIGGDLARHFSEEDPSLRVTCDAAAAEISDVESSVAAGASSGVQSVSSTASRMTSTGSDGAEEAHDPLSVNGSVIKPSPRYSDGGGVQSGTPPQTAASSPLARAAVMFALKDDVFEGEPVQEASGVGDVSGSTMTSSVPVAISTASQVTATSDIISSTPPVFEDRTEADGGHLLRDDSFINLAKTKQRPPSKAPDDSEFKQRPRSGVLGFERILSNLFTPDMAPIEVPLQIPVDQHYVLPSTPDSPPLIIYEEEPSSVIAFAMSSSEYKKKMVDLKTQLKTLDPNMSLTDTGSPTDPDCPLPELGKSAGQAHKGAAPNISDTSYAAAAVEKPFLLSDPMLKQDGDFADFMKDDVDNERFGNRDAERAKMELINCHLEMQFTEKNAAGDKMAQFYCKVYFAEHFRKLRKLLIPSGDDMFIHSLTRCVKWQAKGGKSGLRFCKTLDDRFILKQLSKYEIQSFLEFAPHYFSYLTTAHKEKKPTALAKIVGIYRIGFRNYSTGAAMKQDLLVMENLFYQRTLSKVFDLKGSIRNRLVNTSRRKDNSEDVVLLDENLLRYIVESPLYVRPHSKTVLQQAVYNDSHFLSSHLVMDYSLLVGIDDQTKELVVGIIDYIRTFTWDKKLEMVVKSSAFLGGQGKMPTIVSPEVYRTRFVEAMERYFYLVPDRWSGLAEADC